VPPLYMGDIPLVLIHYFDYSSKQKKIKTFVIRRHQGDVSCVQKEAITK